MNKVVKEGYMLIPVFSEYSLKRKAPKKTDINKKIKIH